MLRSRSAARARWEARAWMAFTLAGVLLACLVAFLLAPLRALAVD